MDVFVVRTLSGREQGEREWSIHRQLRANGFTRMPAILTPYFEQNGLWYQVQEYRGGNRPDPTIPGMAKTMAQTAKLLSGAMPEGMIHGDLGPWNMLCSEDGALFAIDFGEARQGNPYFDFATLFAGVINHTPSQLREQVCADLLKELNCDRICLLEQVDSWAKQGKTRWAGVDESMTARFDHALKWAKEHIYEL